MGDMRISMLVELKAAAARAEAAGLRGELDGLGKTARTTGQEAGGAATGVNTLGTAIAKAGQDATSGGAGILAAGDASETTAGDFLRAVTAAQSLDAVVGKLGASMARIGPSTALGTFAALGNASLGIDEIAADFRQATDEAGLYQSVLDQVRAKYDPLFAASQRYEMELRDIAEAEQMGALSAIGAAQARDRAAQSLTPLANGLRRVGSQATNTGAAVTQLGYQFNDIGMMIASGQNPLMLALQQGTQITQVLGPMGAKGAVKALGGAFMGLLNPVNLVTYAVIAGGAALIQWAMTGKKSAEELRKSFKSVEEAIDEVKLKTLSIRFGESNTSVAKVMDEMAMISAELDVINAKWRASSSLSTRQRLAEEARLLKIQYAEAAKLVEAYRAAVAEQDLLAASTARARQQFSTMFGLTTIITDTLRDAGDEAERLAVAGPRGGWLAGAIADAASLGGALWDAASAAVWLRNNKAGGTVDLANQYRSYGEGRVIGEQAAREDGALYGGNYTDIELGRTKPKSSRDGGGSRKAETNSVLELIRAEERELAVLRETDPVKRELLEKSEQLTGATTAQKSELEALIRTRLAEKAALEAIKQAQEELKSTMKSAFVGWVTGANSFRDALSQVLGKLAEMAASSAFDMLWGVSGGGGFLNNLVTGLLGGTPAHADGGRIGGTGGPREDNHLVRVSTGEYIVNAAATANALPLLQAINAGVPVDDLMGVIAGARPMAAFADGGLLQGSGGPREDNHVVRVSSGEYIVNAAATANALPLLQAINAGVPVDDLMGVIAGARSMAAFADGGLIGNAPAGYSAPASWATGGDRSGAAGPVAYHITNYQTIHVDGATGNTEIREMVAQGVKAGQELFDREVLPSRVLEVIGNQRISGR